MEIQNDNESIKTNTSFNKDKCILLYTCYHCGLKINTIQNDSNSQSNSNYFKEKIGNYLKEIKTDDICLDCKRNFVKCSVCLCPIKLNKDNNECIIYCAKCFHGGHYEHYKEWFNEFNECPNYNCNCRCQEDPPKIEVESSTEI